MYFSIHAVPGPGGRTKPPGTSVSKEFDYPMAQSSLSLLARGGGRGQILQIVSEIFGVIMRTLKKKKVDDDHTLLTINA